MIRSLSARLRRAARRATLLLAIAAACGNPGPLEVTQPEAQSISAKHGQDIIIRLQAIGGEYQNPPEISGAAVRFVEVSLASPYVPAGPTQLFRFTAVSRGQAVVRFRHSNAQLPEFSSTIVVR